MGKKLLDLNAAELAEAMLEMAEPIGNLVNDETLWETFKKCTAKGIGVKERSGLEFLLKTYAEVIPLLLSEEHRLDCFKLLSVIEGEPISKLMKINGRQMLEDAYKVVKEQLIPFFTPFAPTARRG